MEKVFIAEYTPEALEQFNDLDIKNQDKILAAIKTFEIIGTKYKNINQLDYGLYEIKPKGVRAYFKYDEKNDKMIHSTTTPREDVRTTYINRDEWLKSFNQ